MDVVINKGKVYQVISTLFLGPVTSSSQEAFILEGSRSHSMDGVETSPIVSSNRDTGHSTDGVEASSVISSNSDTGEELYSVNSNFHTCVVITTMNGMWSGK